MTLRRFALPAALLLAAVAAAAPPRVFLLSPDTLLRVREAIRSGGADVDGALRRLRQDADKVLLRAPVSVMEKAQLPPSGNRHDYMSLAPYWWPGPDSAGGPYIRRDGEVNPERETVPDRKNLRTLTSSVFTLGLAYWYTGEEAYARHAAAFLRTWFLDTATCMTPRLVYAQAVKGRNEGRAAGLIETSSFRWIVEGLGLLEGSPAWTAADRDGMTRWFSEYYGWLTTSATGLREAAAKNNHGTWYDVQAASIALYLGRNEDAAAILSGARTRRIAAQIEPDGRMPLELVRTKALGYTTMNIEAFLSLVALGRRVNTDLWAYATEDGRSIRRAMDWALPYWTRERAWDLPQIVPFEFEECFPLLVQAWRASGDARYAAAARTVYEVRPDLHRSALLYGAPLVSRGRTVTVATVAQLRTAAGEAEPGDTILVEPGTLVLERPVIFTVAATPGSPVVLRARVRGGTVLAGDSRFVLERAAHVVIEGFAFRSDYGPAVELRGCTGVRVTRNTFRLSDTQPGAWVLITGSKRNPEAASRGNRVDHNLFEQKRVLGNCITIEGSTAGTPQVSQYDTIAHNHFRDIGPRIENALEAIRIGNSGLSLSSGFTLIERNLFERCDGDPEYISIKSSDNTIRHNTFRECLGSLSLRHGNRNRVEGNFILGNGRSGSFTDSTGRTWTLGTGGVRFCGDGMVIVNNYTAGLTGTEWDAALAVTNGDADYGDGQSLNKHFRIRDALIAFNTFVDNTGGLEIGYDGGGFQGNRWPLPPSGLVIANNVFVGAHGGHIRQFAVPERSRWEGNILFTRGGTPALPAGLEGVRVLDPALVPVDGLLRPAAESPLVDAAVGLYPDVLTDVDAQERGARKDIGADEVSTSPRRNAPLTAGDVGPDAP